MSDALAAHLHDVFGVGGDPSWEDVAAEVRVFLEPKHEARKPSPLTMIGRK